MNKIKILVCCHKDDIIIDNEPYTPIQVGKAVSKLNLGIISDDTGDNISVKNPYYCELTAMYWAWKNLHDIEYIGLCHYRRYFDFHKQVKSYQSSKIVSSNDFRNIKLSLPLNLFSKIDNGAIYLAKHETYRCSNFLEYSCYHISDDMRTLQTLIENDGQRKYIEAFNDIMYRDNKLCPFNMFIMKKEKFDAYCEWLFHILFRIEKMIDISSYSTYQKRIFGFMGERLLNIYVKANDIKIIETPILLIDDNNTNRNLSFTKSVLNNIRANLSFMLVRPVK